MEKAFPKIVMAQMNVQPGQPEINYTAMKRQIMLAKEENAAIIIFPELCLSGTMIGDRFLSNEFIDDCLYYGDKIRELSQDIVIIFGNVARESHLFNALYIAQNGVFIKPQNSYLPFAIKTTNNDSHFSRESRYFTSLLNYRNSNTLMNQSVYSSFLLHMQGKNYSIGAIIGNENIADIPLADSSGEAIVKPSVDFYVHIHGTPMNGNAMHTLRERLSRLAKQEKRTIFSVNCVGMQNNGKSLYSFVGESMVYLEDGSYMSLLAPYVEGLSIHSMGGDSSIVERMIPWSENEETTQKIASDDSEMGRIYKALFYSVKEMTNRHHIEKVVIGVSGGIDSAINAALYTAVLGKDNVYLVSMPSVYNSETTKDLAKDLATNLQCPFTTIPITDGVTQTIAELEGSIFQTPTGKELPLQLTTLQKENIQARERSSRILAGVAASLGAVFTCNANKTEIAIGYGTLYGDIAGFLAATGDLWKYQMYDLGRYMNEKVFGYEAIPEGIFTVLPSAELSENQDITQGKGDPLQYEYHDRLFRAFMEPKSPCTPGDILKAYDEGTLQQLLDIPHPISFYFSSPKEFVEDLEHWWKLFSGFAAAKRIQAPPIIAVSPRVFGGDYLESQLLPYLSKQYQDLKAKIIVNTEFKN